MTDSRDRPMPLAVGHPDALGRVGICIYVPPVTPSRAVTRDEIIEMIGEVDDAIIERIRLTGITVDELAEAIDDLEGRFANTPHVPSSPRVADVRRVLDDVFHSDDE